jgi:cyclase
MLKKRLIGVISIYNNIAVQSFNFKKILPLGSPKVLIENLDRWHTDEIIINDFSVSKKNDGPNFKLIKELGETKNNTPLVYGGGIRNAEDAVKIINMGFERIMLDNLYFYNPDEIIEISKNIGSQAVIISLPLDLKKKIIYHYNYIKEKKISFDLEKLITYINFFSEILLIDYKNEGSNGGFNIKLLKSFLKITKNIPVLAFGGISKSNQILNILKHNRVQGVCIGNSLNYRENSVQSHKEYLQKKRINNLRPSQYIKNII